jgi:hypothetical protein
MRPSERREQAVQTAYPLATELEPSCTLVEMARLQGDGVLRRIEAPLVDRGL